MGASGGQTVSMETPSRVPFHGQYIAGPLFDWIFFIGSPLIAVVVVLGAASFMPADGVEYYVLTYMAIGHHVPTLLRAYGDPDEFSRNRFQLLTIPLLVGPLVLFLAWTDARLLTLIFVWDQYHFVRQNYGFMRIYNVKAGVGGQTDVRLDQWLCFSFFIAILAHSDFYAYMYADSFYNLGIQFPGWLTSTVANGSLVVSGVVGLLYVGRVGSRVVNGEPVAWLKLILFATNFGVWYYAYVELSHGFLSYAISSFFHCLQYDAFAWYYNRTKARSLEPSRGNALFRVIHERRYLGLYVVAILAYGIFSTYGRNVTLVGILALNTTTGLLHYYFDSFIWRVQRPHFRKYL